MAQVLTCTASTFDGLTNPYTGEPIETKMLVRPSGDPLFFAPDTYCPAKPVSSRVEAMALWDRINSVHGLKSGREIRCAYTGQPLTLQSGPEGFWFSGGLDTSILRPWSEYLYYMNMRNGKPSPKHPKPAQMSRVEYRADTEYTYETEDDVERTTDAEDYAADIVDRHGKSSGVERKTTVQGASFRNKPNKHRQTR